MGLYCLINSGGQGPGSAKEASLCVNNTPKTRFHRELQGCFFGGRPVVTAAFCIVRNGAVPITEDICCFRFPSGYRL